MASGTQPRAGVQVPPLAAEPTLDSWKAIAGYLKRDVRTVQRWEKFERLPVHRHLHQNRATVYAYPAQIDAWWRERQPELEGGERGLESSPPWRRWMAWAALAIVGAAIAVGVWRWTLRIPISGASAQPIRLAVLPFENLSGDQKQEFFADGLTEEMTTRLASLSPQGLTVIARTSAARYKDSEKDTAQIARELGVDYLLASSVQREGERLRVTSQLVGAKEGTLVWAEIYDREIGQILPLQRELAETIARQLQISLPRTRMADTNDTEAHLLYLEGRYHWNKRRPESLKRAASQYQAAIDRDPNYARAWAGLATAYALFDEYNVSPPREAYPRARAAAARALELDPAQVEARAALAQTRRSFDWDWEGAEQEFRAAIAMNPNYSVAHHWYGMSLMAMGRCHEAREQFQNALAIDPLSNSIPIAIGASYYHEGKFDEAIAQYLKVLEFQPRSAGLRFHIGRAYIQKRMLNEALEHLQIGAQLANGDGDASLAYGYAVAGNRGEALRLLEELHRTQHGGSPYYVAAVHLALGDKDRTYSLLETAVERRIGRVTFLGAEPMFDPIRTEPRFQELVRRIGLLQARDAR